MAFKKIFICTQCAHESPKWEGKCAGCGQWNTMIEEIIERKKDKNVLSNARYTKGELKPLHEVKSVETVRMYTPDGELNRVLGGGIVPGSVVLIGGQPGIGKSTLLLQMAIQINAKVLYVSGEESAEQIKMRADRIGIKNENCFVFTETNIEQIQKMADDIKPDLVVIDSIQTLSSQHLDSTIGSISQVRECTNELQRYAKENNLAIFIIGHINKEGDIAGPKLLEHIVDTVLQFEGDRNYFYRILRTKKNRFGSTDELGIYEMNATGLREISNPSELLITQKDENLSGSAIGATIEGSRPMMIEVQALVSNAVYGNPQRTATGFDLRRLSMLLAVLEKKCGFPFGQQDVFLNMAGGIKVEDPALDLAIVMALVSSKEDITIFPNICFAGEIGLSGEIRAVSRIENRIQEAEKLGFEKIYISKYNTKGLTIPSYQIQVIPVGKLEDLFVQLLG